jgi:hypothetical protein
VPGDTLDQLHIQQDQLFSRMAGFRRNAAVGAGAAVGIHFVIPLKVGLLCNPSRLDSCLLIDLFLTALHAFDVLI